MMGFSRRSLAHYAVQQLLEGKSPAVVSKHLAAALIAAKKHKEADLLLSDISQELESRGLLAQATVTSANKLSAQLKTRLNANIKKAVGVKDVSINEVIDQSVIGGVRIETASRSWDQTVARKLSEIRGGI